MKVVPSSMTAAEIRNNDPCSTHHGNAVTALPPQVTARFAALTATNTALSPFSQSPGSATSVRYRFQRVSPE